MAIAIALGGALVLVGASARAAGTRAHTTTSAAKVQMRHTALGNILATRRGFTLYVFSRDSRKHDSCMAISGCGAVWPLLKTGGRPAAGPGVKRSLLGVIKLPNGARQVTYAGHPLYTYIGDSGPGQITYVGFDQFGGQWYAINASGHVVK